MQFINWRFHEKRPSGLVIQAKSPSVRASSLSWSADRVAGLVNRALPRKPRTLTTFIPNALCVRTTLKFAVPRREEGEAPDLRHLTNLTQPQFFKFPDEPSRQFSARSSSTRSASNSDCPNRRFDHLVADLIEIDEHAAFEIRLLTKRQVHKTEGP